MTVEHSDLQVHVRFRGRVFGPYSPDELRSMIQKGKTTTTWEVSLDAQNWRPIQELETLLQKVNTASNAGGRAPSSHSDQIDLGPVIDEALYVGGKADEVEDIAPPMAKREEPVTAELAPPESQWYYAVNDQPQGPVPESELAAMAAAGKVSPNTLVWTVNMSEWRPLRETRLARHLRSTPQTRQPVTQPPQEEEPVETEKPRPQRSFAEEMEVVLDEETQHLQLWFRVLLGAAIAKAVVSFLGLLYGGSAGVLGLLCDMAIAGSLIGVALLVLRIINRLHLGVRFLARPKRLDELYPVEKPKRRESPWSDPVTDER